MKQEIKAFLKDEEKKILRIEYSGNKLNPYLEWFEWRNPLKIFFNAVIYELCKILPPSRIKNSLLRATGVKIGSEVAIAPEVALDPIFPELITIEDGAIIGWGSRILTHESTIKNFRLGRVRIGKQSLIGAFSVLRSGVTIGKNSIVSMSSFVNKDVNDGELVGGVPGKIIKKLNELI